MLGFQKRRGRTDRLCDRLWQVGDVQVGRLFVSLSLEASVEALPCEANFIAKKVEGLDALLGVTDILELGKAESVQISVSSREAQIAVSTYPLQAPVVVSIIALLCSTSPNREAYFSKSSSSVVG